MDADCEGQLPESEIGPGRRAPHIGAGTSELEGNLQRAIPQRSAPALCAGNLRYARDVLRCR